MSFDVDCICHLADLTFKASIELLPVDIDKLFIDVFITYHSSKREQDFCDLWCSLFMSGTQTILKHCTTRWLSLLHCVGRFIAQFDGLRSYFLSCVEAETSEVVSILERLETLSPSLSFFFFLYPSLDGSI